MSAVDDELMTPEEVARLFKVNRQTVIRWIQAGRLEGVKTPGGKHRVFRSEVEAAFATPHLVEGRGPVTPPGR